MSILPSPRRVTVPACRPTQGLTSRLLTPHLLTLRLLTHLLTLFALCWAASAAAQSDDFPRGWRSGNSGYATLDSAATYLQRGDRFRASEMLERAQQEIERDLSFSPERALAALDALIELQRSLGRNYDPTGRIEFELAAQADRYGERNPKLLPYLTKLVRLYRDRSRLPDELRARQRVLAILLAQHGEQDDRVWRAMTEVAPMLDMLGKRAEAVATYKKVAELSSGKYGERDPRALSHLHSYGMVLGRADQRGEQLVVMERWARLTEESAGPDHARTLGALSTLAQLHREAGNTAKAQAALTRALGLSGSLLGETNVRTVGLLAEMADLLRDQRRHAEEYGLRVKAVQALESTLGARADRTIEALEQLVRACAALGRRDEQIAIEKRLVELRASRRGGDLTLAAVRNLASTLGDVGRFGEELALRDRVLQERATRFGEADSRTLQAMLDLAGTYQRIQRHREALVLQEHVIAQLQARKVAHNDVTLLNANTGLASTYLVLGRHQEALALGEERLAFFRSSPRYGATHASTLAAMTFVANAMSWLGRYEAALPLYEQVLEARTQALGDRHPVTLRAQSGLANAYALNGRFDDALRLRESVTALYRQVLGDQHPDTLQSLAGLASSLTRAGRLKEAAALSAPYVDGSERLRAQPGLPAEDRQALFARYADSYRLFSILHARTGSVAEAFRLGELSKARTLLESMALRGAGRLAGLPADESRQLQELGERVATNTQELAQTSDVAARRRLDAQRNTLVREHEQLQQRLRSQYPKFAQLSEVRIIGQPELPGLIGPDTLAVSFVIHGADVSAWLINPAGDIKVWQLGTDPFLSDAVELVRRASQYPRGLQEVRRQDGVVAWRLKAGGFRMLAEGVAPPEGASPVATIDDVSRYLAAGLLGPLATELASARRWLISPDGPLAQLPFELLPFGAEGRPVIAERDVHYTQSLSVYALTRARQKEYEGLRERRSLFAMGDPVYQRDQSRHASRAELTRTLTKIADKSAERPNLPVPARPAEMLRELDDKWIPLPGTQVEVLTVAKLFSGSADVHLGAAASEHSLQQLNARGVLRNYRYMLFSTHGYLSTHEPSLSSVVLSLIDRVPGTDGYVTAAEWPAYDLRSDLLVLSACDTGVGRVVSGEGVMGLPYALFVAGNVNTILSLWPVDDEATVPFMQSLFEKIKAGVPAAQALAQTKREFLSGARGTRLTAPVFWAPFILVGAG